MSVEAFILTLSIGVKYVTDLSLSTEASHGIDCVTKVTKDDPVSYTFHKHVVW